MFAAAISLVGLAATVYLVLREAKAIRAQSGAVAKGAIAWSVAFGLFQVFLTIWGAVGLVAQNEPLAFVMLALILVVDFVLYYPFFRAYDAQKCAEEAEISQEELAAKNAEKAAKLNDAFQGKADAKSVAAGAAAEAVKADAPAASAAGWRYLGPAR